MKSRTLESKMGCLMAKENWNRDSFRLSSDFIWFAKQKGWCDPILLYPCDMGDFTNQTWVCDLHLKGYVEPYATRNVSYGDWANHMKWCVYDMIYV